MTTRTQYVIGLIVLTIADWIIPLPILGFVLLYVLFEKPRWFRKAVREIYSD